MKSKDFLDEISGKSINFLVGAGASSGVVPTLWIESINKSYEDILSSQEYSEEQKNVLYYLWFTLWIRKTKISEKTSHNADILKSYCDFIDNLVRITNNEGYDKQKRVNIFTSNYDTFFELSFDNHAINNRLCFLNDGSRGFINKHMSTEDFYLSMSHSGMSDSFQRSIPMINLIKLHGSVTWVKDSDRIKVSIENEKFNDLVENNDKINDKIEGLGAINTLDSDLSSNFSIDTLETYLQDGSFTEEDLIDKIDRLNVLLGPDFEDFKILYDNLPVVNPTKRKFQETVFEQHYYQMLRLLSFELEKKNTVLIVFGFSFADEHILEIVRRSMVNPQLKIYVISYDEKSQQNAKRLLGNETRIEYLPKFNNTNPATIVTGNFEYLNSLLDGQRG